MCPYLKIEALFCRGIVNTRDEMGIINFDDLRARKTHDQN
jgi:hypothetical protein